MKREGNLVQLFWRGGDPFRSVALEGFAGDSGEYVASKASLILGGTVWSLAGPS